MKRLVFATFCLSMAAFPVHALEEAHVAFGPSYQHLFNVSGDSVQLPWGNNGLVGFNSNCYAFWNGSNIGLFVVYNMLFSTYITDPTDRSLNTAYRSAIIQGVVGPGFRRVLAPNLTLLGGLGLNCYTHGVYTDSDDEHRNIDTVNFGAAGQAGIKLDLTNVLCLTLGVNAGYTFVNYTEDYTGEFAGWALKSNIAVNPYIGFGFNRHDYKYWGKPESVGKK